MSALLDMTLTAIREKRDDIEARFGIRLLGVVGSVARGDEKPESDIDLVYDIAGRPTLFDLSNAAFELEKLLGRSIDLVDPKAMRPAARTYIERDLVLA